MRAFALALGVAVAGCSDGGGGGGTACPDPVAATSNGHAMSFAGGGRIEAPAADLTQYSSATVEAWVRRTGATGADRQVFGKGEADALPAFALFAGQSRHLAAGFASTDGTQFESSVTTGAQIPADGTWTHLAVAWSSSSISFFLDGNVLINTTSLTGPGTQSGAPLAIGAGLDASAAGDGWDGDVDEVRFWGVERLGGDILADMTSMLDGTEPGLLAAWSFEEGGGSRAADLTGTCHTGRLAAGASFIDETPF